MKRVSLLAALKLALRIDNTIVISIQAGTHQHQAVNIGDMTRLDVVAHIAVNTAHLACGVALHIDGYPSVAVGGTRHLGSGAVDIVHIQAHLELL